MFYLLGVINADLGSVVTGITTIIGLIMWIATLKNAVTQNKTDISEIKESHKKELKEIINKLDAVKNDHNILNIDLTKVKGDVSLIHSQGEQILSLLTK